LGCCQVVNTWMGLLTGEPSLGI